MHLLERWLRLRAHVTGISAPAKHLLETLGLSLLYAVDLGSQVLQIQ
jgi:hypothetical protein